MMFDRKIHTQMLKDRFDSAYLDGSNITPAELIDEMVATIDADISSATYLIMFDYAMALALVEAGAKYVTVAVSTVNPKMNAWAESVGFTIQDFRDIEEQNLSFDVIIANPPYKGTAALHQAFFNVAIGLLKDDGQMTFIQPATPYFNKKTNLKKAELEMQDNLRKYHVNVKIVTGKIFKNAAIATDLAITTLTKTETDNNFIDEFTTMSGDTLSNVALEDIYGNEATPSIARSIRTKLFDFINANGSLQDIVHDGEKRDDVFYVQKIRGNAGRRDFYTLISDNAEYWYMGSDYGLIIKDGQTVNVVSYLTSYVARFAFSLLKFSANSHRGELKFIPLVDFDQTWDDAKLCELFGLTDEEFAEIKRVITPYHQGV